ncbi:ParB/RepB/Spo0J family partition protein [Kordiimonas sp. SCSIO 12610]|uniref:ParB/RepB/Spo0J family partition protein n=1 Tax=Kordiimonas sp. SCSIO 12610 TaxID=2829597 RepID=UPI00210EA67A|nr:ParB/RepB/Spo0J family partition protein [Kordiimonas sp. SCSIO 12610]UTW55480.1 ParB/RepB/Spo0J family partition protein [Kordiimonas sp. SCSIO 12610]
MVRKGLGKGLSALLGDDRPVVDALEDTKDGSATSSGPASGRRLLPIEFLERNKAQPRHHFDEDHLEELTNSIKEKGVLQPILVRSIGVDKYQIVAGERRWRAAQKAGVHEVPVIVRDLDDGEVLQVAIIENIQRQDLSSVEEAIAFKRLMDEFGHTQEGVAEVVGKSRSHVANLLRLLSLPEDVQKLVDEGKLSMGHARALIGAENPSAIARRIVAEGLSVRQVEEIIRGLKGKQKRQTVRKSNASNKDADTVALEKDLSAAMGMKTTIAHEGEGGSVTIRYEDLEQLDELCSKLGVCGF